MGAIIFQCAACSKTTALPVGPDHIAAYIPSTFGSNSNWGEGEDVNHIQNFFLQYEHTLHHLETFLQLLHDLWIAGVWQLLASTKANIFYLWTLTQRHCFPLIDCWTEVTYLMMVQLMQTKMLKNAVKAVLVK